MAGSVDVVVIGAGPAGLMAALWARMCGARTTVLEAGAVPGRKLLLTGGGRCNLTHAGHAQDILAELGPRGRFLRQALHEMPPSKVIEFFHGLGLNTRAAPQGEVFPATDRAIDVRDALVREAERRGVTIFCGRRVAGILCKPPGFAVATDKQEILADRVILASGGLSYPGTGSTGDGLRIAAMLGHRIIEPRPALVPLVTRETWPCSLSGVALEQVMISARPHGRKVSQTGAMLFTQDGIGGPAVLDLSRHLTDLLPNREDPIEICVDLVPGTGMDDMERQALRWSQVSPRKTIQHILADLVPRRLAGVLAGQAGCASDLQACQLTKETRRRLLAVLKSLDLHVEACRPMAEATVTRGGVDTGQIDSKTLESKVCKGLFFAGEVMDVDGPCGGYNLQICWSTGALAGRSAACGR